ncbi:hypothetical protein [Microvirga sp. BSC39]|uniref:hypothetical protein n=1 Tax=Microvirga sp. BSC39 TaxID=1549810 RepID=UPI0004E8FB50|nr:hypothetical protein [Microvirga sp. BSC39]KFG69746.1 hypothetical protein JH26_08785 [Microvirga sp. BSC39]
MQRLIGLNALAIALIGSGTTLGQAQGLPAGEYRLTPVLTHENVNYDPDEIWSEAELTPFGIPARLPSIYTDQDITNLGLMTFSVVDNTCNRTNDCEFRIMIRLPRGSKSILATGKIMLGGTAVVADDLTTVTTETSTGIQTFRTGLTRTKVISCKEDGTCIEYTPPQPSPLPMPQWRRDR